MNSLKTVHYAVGKSRNVHPGRMFADLLSARGLAWQLFVRNLRAHYRQTLLGYVWVIVPPLAITVLWVFLQSQNVVTYRGETPYVVYLLTGMLWWQLFAEAVQAPMRIVAASQAMLTQVNFPRESLLLAGLLETLFNFLVRLLVLLLVLVLTDQLRMPEWVVLALGGAGLLVTGSAFGLWMVPLGMLYRDVDKGMNILLQFWLYLTPVVYLQPPGVAGRWQVVLNPAAQLLIMARDGSLGVLGYVPLTGLIWLAVGVAALFVGWMLYRIAMPVIIERMST